MKNEIQNIRNTYAGYRGEYDGETVIGSWMDPPGLSWWSPAKRRWLVVGGHWQDYKEYPQTLKEV